MRIPSTVLEAAHLHPGQPVAVRAEDGRVIIAPLHLPHYDIDALVACITDDNRHNPADMGPPTGQEVW